MKYYRLFIFACLLIFVIAGCQKEDKLYITAEPGYVFDIVQQTHFLNKSVLYQIEEQESPWTISLLEIDISDPKNMIKAGSANDSVSWEDFGAINSGASLETLRNAVERIEKDQGTVIAAINGGFFNTSTGFGMDPVVTNGEVLSSGDGVARGILFVDENNVPSIRVASLTNTVISPGGTSFDANNMNGGRAANYLSILTPKMIGNDGASTSNRWGVELRIELLEEEPHHLRANGTTKYRVIDKGAEWTNVSPMTNDRQLILSGHGIAHHFLLDNFNVGDMVEIESTFIGAEDITIKEALPGWGHFIKDEFNATALAYSDVSQGGEGSMFHEYQRHPRSFIAYNRDKTILYMGVVEGRVDHSIGMDINEVAYFLFKFLDFDVLDALNLDGGGSSTLMAEKLEIIPSPRSFQRSIANFLYIIRE